MSAEQGEQQPYQQQQDLIKYFTFGLVQSYKELPSIEDLGISEEDLRDPSSLDFDSVIEKNEAFFNELEQRILMREEENHLKLQRFIKFLSPVHVTDKLKVIIASDYNELINDEFAEERHEVLNDQRFPYLQGTEGIFSSDKNTRMKLERFMYFREAANVIQSQDVTAGLMPDAERILERKRKYLERWRQEFDKLYGESLIQP